MALEAETAVPQTSTSEVLAQAASRADPEGETDDLDIWEDDAPVAAGASGRVPDVSRSDPSPGTSQRRVVVIDDDIDIPVSAPPTPTPPDEPRTAGGQVGATLEDEGSPKRRWRLFRKGGE
ncbi:MAG: hypothetical protein H0W82_06660 [Actinobacteria bacterium]|nr:hypothetical protein [Actinomycetota bacterium]